MAIYKIQDDALNAIPEITFADAGIRERQDLQRFLRERIEVISPDTLVIAEEFGDWDDSRRRIDLLGVDREANLVVIELKRTEDGGHMELQAIRYASMVSALTFPKAVDIYSRHLASHNLERDAEEELLEFLGWDEPQEDDFAQQTRIVLASAEFSRELTSSVLWLAEHGVDIRCVRFRPYGMPGQVLLHVQQVIPLPEAEDYQVQVREKKQRERTGRNFNPDFTKYTVTIGDRRLERLPKRRAILAVVKALCNQGIAPEDIEAQMQGRSTNFYSVPGECTSAEMLAALEAEGVGRYAPKRWFIEDDELIRVNGNTYSLINQWGNQTGSTMRALLDHFKPENISFEKAD